MYISHQNNSSLPLSISETARLFGLSDKTIRRAIKSHELPVMIVKGRYRIQFKDVLAWSQERPRLSRARDTKGIGQFIVGWRSAEVEVVDESKPQPQPGGQLRLID
ncbi:MAG: hypothetical protein CMI52_02070 [Parcubacteria group bacterium]|nr:hypothetical protein [Parcubacteria group bacterium]